MKLVEILQKDAEEILNEAMRSMKRAHLEHYEAAGAEETHRRLKSLYDLTANCVSTLNVTPMVRYAEEIAAARFASGVRLHETQTAFNVLEEVIWHRILENVPPAELARALGLISTVLGMGKDALARKYVSLASSSEAPSLDLKAALKGTDGV
jgi:hypothetical protein